LPLVTRGSQPEKFDRSARNRAERILQDEADAHPSARAYHALAQLYLAEHRLDEATEQFDKALKLDAKNARLHNDYAVALMEMGKTDQGKGDLGGGFEAFARSFEHLNQAADLDNSLLEALFNRALCLEYMALASQAAGAWRNYLEKDGNSPWADEARRHLSQFEGQERQS